MSGNVQKIAEQVKKLRKKEFEEFLSWLTEYAHESRRLENNDQWDQQIERDSQPGGKLDSVLKRVREDISAGKTKPLDEVIHNS